MGTIPKPEGRRLLEQAGYRQLEIGGHPDLEWWAKSDGFPVTVPGSGQAYDKEALEAILAGK